MPSDILKELNRPRKKVIYRELRCMGCRALICHEYITSGYLMFECKRCNEVNRFDFRPRFNAKNK